jgi:hypothetical protein
MYNDKQFEGMRPWAGGIKFCGDNARAGKAAFSGESGSLIGEIAWLMEYFWKKEASTLPCGIQARRL